MNKLKTFCFSSSKFILRSLWNILSWIMVVMIFPIGILLVLLLIAIVKDYEDN